MSTAAQEPGSWRITREFTMGIILASIQLICFAALAAIALIVAARSTNDDDKE